MRNILLALLVLISAEISAQIGEKNFIDLNYIEVTGKSEMEVTPDLIYLKVQLSEKDTKNKVSVSQLESKMIGKLTEIGIDIKKDVLIKDISSNFKEYLLTRNTIFLSKEYQILVRDGKTASQVFIGLEEIGISNVSIERLDNSNIIQFRKDVKVNAIKAAKEKAELLAMAVNQSIGRALYIKEFEYNYFNDRYSNKIVTYNASAGGAVGDLPPDFSFEKIKLEYSILCRFELK